MTYGLQVKNSSGNIIIDGQYKNYAEWATGTTTLGAYVTTISFTATDKMPLVALRPATNKAVVLWGLRKTGSNYDGFYVIGSNGDSLDWKVYTAHPVASSETYGLRSYGSTGDLLFDSGYKYFSIFQINTGISLSNPAGGTLDYEDISHGSISDPYYFLSPLGFWVFSTDIMLPRGPLFIWRSCIIKLSATSVRVTWGRIFTGLTSGIAYAEGWNPSLNLMVLK